MANSDQSKTGDGDPDPPASGPYRGKPGEVIDPAKVDVYRGGRSLEVKPGDVKVGRDGLVQPTHGLSFNTDPTGLGRHGGACRVRSIPDELQLVQRGTRDTHFEAMAKEPIPLKRYQELVRLIELE